MYSCLNANVDNVFFADSISVGSISGLSLVVKCQLFQSPSSCVCPNLYKSWNQFLPLGVPMNSPRPFLSDKDARMTCSHASGLMSATSSNTA